MLCYFFFSSERVGKISCAYEESSIIKSRRRRRKRKKKENQNAINDSFSVVAHNDHIISVWDLSIFNANLFYNSEMIKINL